MEPRKREGTDVKGTGTAAALQRGASPEGVSRRRACLIVSLIILVWNIGASGRLFLFGPPSFKPTAWPPCGNPPEAGPKIPSVGTPAQSASGEHTVKQRFLLGIKVDINRAGFREIADLPGISDAVARSVVETRSRIGTFKRPEDLLQVKGIKEKRLKKILPFLAAFPNN